MSLRSHPVLHISLGAGSLGSSLSSPLLGRAGLGATTEGPDAAAEDAPGGIVIGATNAEQLREPLLAQPKVPQPAGPSRLASSSSPAQPLPLTLLEDSPDASKGSSFASLVVILSKTIVGAGETWRHAFAAWSAHCAPPCRAATHARCPPSHPLARCRSAFPALQAPRRCPVPLCCWDCC